uniref:Uncharacterized protein n=1 Tax=Cyprinus carpio TaxID=7962 RepID=A0A8C1F6R6_CYPCA
DFAFSFFLSAVFFPRIGLNHRLYKNMVVVSVTSPVDFRSAFLKPKVLAGSRRHLGSASPHNWQDAENYCMFQIHLCSHNSCSCTAQIQSVPTGISLWMGAHDSITEGGWTWMDGSPFRYINWASGNPDDYYNEDCLSILINSGAWNDDDCDNKRGYICKRRGTFHCPNHMLRNDI